MKAFKEFIEDIVNLFIDCFIPAIPIILLMALIYHTFKQ